jgi:ubiquinone/menaquinone biosynthesis C-methylase UbiE
MANERFEGVYGRLYNSVIQTPALRRAAFSLWGHADPLIQLDTIVRDAACEAADGTVLDIPCGGGTVLPLFARAGFRGTVIESDLADAMMRRAEGTHRRLQPGYAVRLLQADARDLPLDDSSVDCVISINGLHVIPAPARFLSELARVVRPGGALWLITPVSSSAFRNRSILALARTVGITPGSPPTLEELHTMVDIAGFQIRRSLGGTSITGLVCDRRRLTPSRTG